MPLTPSTSIEKALDLLIALGQLGGSAGLLTLAEHTSVPKSSAHRLLQSLVSRGLVARSAQGDYQLGLALVALGELAQRGDALLSASEPALREAARETGQSCFLVVARDGRLEVVLVAEGSGFLRAMPTVGAQVPVHASASGRLYLAFDAAQVSAPGDTRLERFTPSTVASARTLRKLVARAKERGYDTNVSEWMPDVAVVAAPVQVGEGLVGTVALATSLGHFERVGEAQLARAVRQAAEEIRDQLELARPMSTRAERKTQQ
ncbi:MAG: IclR family transcriptional regulator [Sandaracinaceae bacterium]|nr:IclR family transcriptional regulator [Sandaracinaceae bacterium]